MNTILKSIQTKIKHVTMYDGILIGLLLIFGLFYLSTLTSFPTVFPDEVSFGNASFKLFHPQAVSIQPYTANQTLIEETVFTQYGPVYFLVVGFVMKLFGFSIEVFRSVSVIFALLTMTVFYYLLRKSTSVYLSLAGVLLLGVDIFFTRSAKFGRMEIATIFFSLLAYYYYLSYYVGKAQTKKKDIILGILISIPLFTHFLQGLIPLVVIGAHLFLTTSKKERSISKFTTIFVVPVFIFIAWLLLRNLGTSGVAQNESSSFILQKLWTNFGSVKAIWQDRTIYTAINFSAYMLGFVGCIFIYKKNPIALFWVIHFVATTLIIIWGNSYFYFSFISLAFIAIVVLFTEYGNEDVKFFSVFLLMVLFVISCIQQFVVFKGTRDFSYTEYGSKFQTCLPKQAHNVYIQGMQPDPYFYLVAKNPDKRFAYPPFHDKTQLRHLELLRQSDTYVSYAAIEQIITHPEYIAAQSDAIKKKELDAFLPSISPVDTQVLEYVWKHKTSACIIQPTANSPAFIVYGLK